MKIRPATILIFATLLTACGVPEPSGTAITNVTVIDAVNGVRDNQTVVFDGDEITAVRSSGPQISVAETIDGTGKFLIPGLWDFHVHLTYDDRFTDSMPALFLSYGITSVRDTGGLMHKVLPVVEKMRAPHAVAPRVFFAGPLVDSIEHLRNIEMDCAGNTPELHETRLELLKNPHGLSGGDLRSSLHSLQRLPAIAAYDEARCDHVLDTLQSTTQVPTLRLGALKLAPPYLKDDWQDALSRIREDAREDWSESSLALVSNPDDEFPAFGEWALFLIGRMHARGIPIGAGTDTPIFLAVPGYSLHAELELLVRAGLSPLEAIRSATPGTMKTNRSAHGR